MSFLQKIIENNNYKEENKIPLFIDGKRVGQKVADIVKDTYEFKTNCNLVIIDFLVRHGFIEVEDKDYIEIVQGLRR